MKTCEPWPTRALRLLRLGLTLTTTMTACGSSAGAGATAPGADAAVEGATFEPDAGSEGGVGTFGDASTSIVGGDGGAVSHVSFPCSGCAAFPDTTSASCAPSL